MIYHRYIMWRCSCVSAYSTDGSAAGTGKASGANFAIRGQKFPATGDTGNIILWVLAASFTVAMIPVTVTLKRKSR